MLPSKRRVCAFLKLVKFLKGAPRSMHGGCVNYSGEGGAIFDKKTVLIYNVYITKSLRVLLGNCP